MSSQETTPSNINATQILITIPLQLYVDIACGFKERAIVDRVIGETIIRLDPKETITHVEFNEDIPNVASVWRIAEWRKDYQRLTKLRQECERERLISALTRELIVKLTTVMKSHVLTMTMDDERRELMARKLIEKKSWTGIRNLGVDCSELEDVMNKGTT
jgi:hypothetical protein